MADPVKFRADHVGSLLRPPALLRARRRHEAGEIADDELRAAEDEAIAAAVRTQVAAGVDVVTDGEFRRRDFRTGFVQAVDGLSMRTWDMPWHSAEGVTSVPSHTWVATGRLRQRTRLAADEAAYVRSLTSAPVKVTLIAPGFLAGRFLEGRRDGQVLLLARGVRGRGLGDHQGGDRGADRRGSPVRAARQPRLRGLPRRARGRRP
jgi:Cobalamin-independent synthase, Catalytic domain